MIADHAVWVLTGQILPIKIGHHEESLDRLPEDV
jgi:hypothetical protein